MTTIDLNEIISVFLQRHINELTLSDVNNALEVNGKSLSVAEIRHVVCSLGSSLFQIRANSDGIICIRVDPTVSSFHHFCLSVILCHRLLYVTISSMVNVLRKGEDANNFMCVVILIVVKRKIAVSHIILQLEIIDVLFNRRTVKVLMQ
jgi:hypothetical protein